MRLLLLIAVAGLLSASIPARADTIVLTSASNGTYDYGLELNAGEDEGFTAGQTITLTGLSGVTGVTVASDSFFAGSFTADSVTLTEEPQSTSGFGNGTDLNPATFPLFSLTSSVLTEGTVDFSINNQTPPVMGTVDGPVGGAVVPEPSSFVLLGTGLLGLGGILFAEKRRRGAAGAGLSLA
jgi:hypothetical protein